MLALILKYYIIGLAMAAPIGPMSIIIMRRTLNNGLASGLASGLGTTTVEAMYAALIAFGLSFISDFIILHKVIFGLMGGMMLVYLGVKIFFAPMQSTNIKAKHVNLWHYYLSNAVMTTVNPMTIFSFVAIFMGLGFGNMNGDYKAAGFAVLGLALGSTSWYSSYAAMINLARKKINERVIKLVNHVSGLMIIGFGLIAFWKILM